MVEIKGKFFKRGNTSKLVPAAGAYLRLALTHDDEDTDFMVIEGGEEIEYSGGSFLLDHDGALPRDACVRSTDEILPRGSSYFLKVEDSNARRQPIYYCKEGVEIKGDAAVDLTPPPEPEPKVFVPAPMRPFLPRKLGTNYCGFFAGVQSPPALAPCTTPQDGTLPAFTFTLPFRAAVSVLSVQVLVPRAEKHALIALYDANGRRVCSTSIATDHAGACTGALERTMTLNPGEYTLVWLTDVRVEIQGIDFGPSQRDQFRLMNAGGGGVVVGATVEPYDCSGGSLPERIGKIVAKAFVPPLAYLKA
jgi:hypothetical protein